MKNFINFVVGGKKVENKNICYPEKYTYIKDLKEETKIPVTLEYDFNKHKYLVSNDNGLIGEICDVNFANLKTFREWIKNISKEECYYSTNEEIKALLPLTKMPAVLTAYLVDVPAIYKNGSDVYYKGTVQI